MKWSCKDVKELNDLIDQLGDGDVLRIENVPEMIYHASKGIGSTALKAFMRSPAHYDAYLNQTFETTDSQMIGSIAHAQALLQDIRGYFPVPDTIRKNSKEWKALEAEADGRIMVKQKIFDQGIWIGSKAFGAFLLFLSSGVGEVSYWRNKGGMIIKARADYMSHGVCSDLKTTKNVEPDKFGRDFINYGYHIQSAHYKQVIGCDHLQFLVVENQAPYCTLGPYTLSDELKRYADAKVLAAYEDFKVCESLGFYPGFEFDKEQLVVELPRWVK